MEPKLIDTHTHVQFAAFRDDADLVIKRALAAGIWMVNVGSQRSTSERAVELAEKYPEGVYATVGLHPIHTEKSYHDEDEVDGPGFQSAGEEFDYDFYKKLAKHPKVVAIGECGLDYFRGDREEGEGWREKQKKAFIQQIELSKEVRKPLMIHCRDAYDDLIKILDSKSSLLNSPSGAVHFFSGTKDHAQKFLDLGFYFTFGGVITFVHDYDEVVKYIPLDRILLETDAPYVTPAPHRGKRNEPLYVTEVAKKIAEIKNIDLEEVKLSAVNNTRTLLGI